jgi:putative transposase
VFFRRIVGWRTMRRMPTDLPLDALEMALWVRDRAGEEPVEVPRQRTFATPFASRAQWLRAKDDCPNRCG